MAEGGGVMPFASDINGVLAALESSAAERTRYWRLIWPK